MTEHHWRYSGWRVVAACSVGTFFVTIPIHTFGVFLKPLCDHFSWSRESASTAYGAMTLLSAVSAPWLGRLLDRVGAARVIVTCLAASACAVVSLSMLTSNIWHLWIVFAILGVLIMGASPLAYSRAIFGWFDALRGRALGFMLAGSAVAAVVIPPSTQALIQAAGWRLAWVMLGTATLLFAVPVAARYIVDRRVRPAAFIAAAAGTSFGEALQSRVFWTLSVVVFGGTLALNGAIVHTVALLSDRGLPAGQAALAVSMMGGASLAGRLVTGWLLDRFHAVRVSVVLLLIAALGTFLLASAHSIEMAVLATLCLGFGSGGEADFIPYLLSRHFGLRSFSTLYGITWTAWGIGGAVGPIALGRAFDMSGSYTIALVGLALVTLAAGVLMLSVPAVPASRAVHAVSEPT